MSDTTAKNPDRVVTRGFLAKTFDVYSGGIVDTIKKAIEGPLVKGRIEALEARIKELETRPPTPEYCGTFEQGRTYKSGSLLTRQGGLWLALHDTTLPPGGNPTVWRLIVKSGGGER